MFLLKSNQQSNLVFMYDVLKQTGLPLTFNKDECFENILIKFPVSDKMSISFNKIEEFISLPVNVNQLLDCFNKLLSKYEIFLGPLKFNPWKEEISSNGKIIKLRNTHSLILIEALKSKNIGLTKDRLYKALWPNDYNVQINKLDTHLTNLKNLLKEQFNFQFTFSSEKGKLMFYID